MQQSEIDRLAKVIWDYHQLNQPLRKSDAVFCLCSIDTRVAEYAADLFLKGYGDYLIFSGGVAHSGDLLETGWNESEAERFASIAIAKGVPEDKVIIENKAQNTGDNIEFTYKLLQEFGLYPRSLLLVQKPYMERRTYATFKKQWPEPDTEITVSSPRIRYEDYWNEVNPREVVINLMVGDLQRIKEYPMLGHQIAQDIPDDVWATYETLVKNGYVEHLIQ
jgi:uncharacterized SAM-binding protein YcdF (DUF218 family)